MIRAPKRLAVLTTALLGAGFALAAAAFEPRATGDLALIVERASGSLVLAETTGRSALGRIEGLGDLSHAALVYARDQRHAFVFGRDGGLSKVDLFTGQIVTRVMQSGNAIGGAISQDGRLLAVANYTPGGVKVFATDTLELVADIPAAWGENGATSKVVGIADVPGTGFVFSLFDAGEIWIADLNDPKSPRLTKFRNVGAQPYDGLISPDGRWYIAGLFGEPGMAVLDLWHPEQGVRKVLQQYTKDDPRLPVFKMPHLRGWAFAGRLAFLPTIGRHELIVLDTEDWSERARIPVHSQPVFAVARPDAREIWVNFAHPDNGVVQVIDVPTLKVVDTLRPGPAVLHLEFTPRGEQVWVSVRDADKVQVYDTRSHALITELPVQSPSGIFMSARAGRIGL